MSRVVFAAVLSLALAACHRSSGPSEAFAKAQALYLSVAADKGPDAVIDPQMDEALALARQVPEDSIDSASAKAFIEKIETERREYAAAAEKRRAAAELVPDPSTAPAKAPSPVASPDAPDAKAAGTAAYPPLVGSSADEFQKRYGACVRAEAPFVEKGGARQGQVYALASPECEKQHPELAGQYVAVLDGKVFNVVAKSKAPPLEQGSPDAGTPAPQ